MITQVIIIALFVLALKNFSTIKTAKRGYIYATLGLCLSAIYSFPNQNIGIIIFTLLLGGLIGYFISYKINMKNLPQLVAGFHSLVGLASVLINCAIYTTGTKWQIAIGTSIGGITFSGSLLACLKLCGYFKNIKINKLVTSIIFFCILMTYCGFVFYDNLYFIFLLISSLLFGVLFILPIGGADMPVIVSCLNSISGWTAACLGLAISNTILIVIGSLVGTSGAILSHIMCCGMNRSLKDVLFTKDNKLENDNNVKPMGNIQICNTEDAGYLLQTANSVIIVPGYGMATSQAQHALKGLLDKLKTKNISVKFAIHPVAGRMPGHMNVLLAEAHINDEDVFNLTEINNEFSSTDVVLVVGANDITNPAAQEDPHSAIYGMPILEVWKANTVIVIKRSLNPGYSGIDNLLFYKPNTLMLLGDAKQIINQLLDV